MDGLVTYDETTRPRQVQSAISPSSLFSSENPTRSQLPTIQSSQTNVNTNQRRSIVLDKPSIPPHTSEGTVASRRAKRRSMSFFSSKDADKDKIDDKPPQKHLYTLQDLIIGEILTQAREGVLRKAVPKDLHAIQQSNLAQPIPGPSVPPVATQKATVGENPYDEFREAPIETCSLPAYVLPTDILIVKETRITNFSKNEAETLLLFDHPNIIKLKGVQEIVSQQKFYIILEYLRGPDLCDLLQDTEKLSEEEAGALFHQAASAINYLHSRGYVHRDIKLENFLIVEPYDPKRMDNLYPLRSCHLKLIDFEFAIGYDGVTPFTAALGTLRYSSPEVRRKSYLGPEADVWSLGVVLFLLTTGHFPFSKQDLLRKTERLQPDQLPSYFSRHLKLLLTAMLSHDLKERPSAAEILTHFWLELVVQIPTTKKKESFFRRLFTKKK